MPTDPDFPPIPMARFVIFNNIDSSGLETWILRDRQLNMDYPFSSRLSAESALYHPLRDTLKGSPTSVDAYNYQQASSREYFE